MFKYQILIKVPLKALDDVDARQKANEIKKDMNEKISSGSNIKLQRVYENKPPEGVKLNL